MKGKRERKKRFIFYSEFEFYRSKPNISFEKIKSMKFKLSILLIVVVIASGCSNYFSAHKNGGFQSNSKKIIAKGNLKKDSDLLISKENSGIENNLIDFHEEANLSTKQNVKIAEEIENQNSIIIQEPLKNHTRVHKETSECDEIICKNGEIIKAKIIEISEDNIRYRMCPENEDRPSYSILKSKVLVISYKNGEKEVFQDKSAQEASSISKSNISNSGGKKIIDGIGIASLIIGFLSPLMILFSLGVYNPIYILLFGIILALLAIILGSISLGKINKNSDKYFGRGFGLAGLLIGAVILLITIVLFIFAFALIN
jgi:hypothetical protein